jgi:hypothetical protein
MDAKLAAWCDGFERGLSGLDKEAADAVRFVLASTIRDELPGYLDKQAVEAPANGFDFGKFIKWIGSRVTNPAVWGKIGGGLKGVFNRYTADKPSWGNAAKYGGIGLGAGLLYAMTNRMAGGNAGMAMPLIGGAAGALFGAQAPGNFEAMDQLRKKVTTSYKNFSPGVK